MKPRTSPFCAGLLGLCVAFLHTASAQTQTVQISPPGLEPSNAAELAAKKSDPGYDPAADARRKDTMSPEEAAWETVLEQNLGGFYLPGYKKQKLAGRETAWDFVKDAPKLPRVLLIGDSISRGYTLAVRKELAGKANVHRAPENCGQAANGLKKLDLWLGAGKWDVIHFNFGIHDRKTAPTVYSNNLEKVVSRLQATGAKLVWARTTPPASADNGNQFSPEQCEQLNRTADAIMRRRGIVVNDLHAAVARRLGELQNPKDVHFNEAGYQVLGRQAAAEILAALPPRP